MKREIPNQNALFVIAHSDSGSAHLNFTTSAGNLKCGTKKEEEARTARTEKNVDDGSLVLSHPDCYVSPLSCDIWIFSECLVA